MKDHGSHTAAIRRQTQRCLDTLKAGRQHALQLQALAELLPFNQDARRSLSAIATAMPQLDAVLSALGPLARQEDGR